MLNFEKPIYKITEYVENNNYGKFELEPLERGFGTTLGNALRRVMLSSMPGSAIVAVKIEGVMHEFQTIEGVVEDVTAIVLNLKDVVIKNHSEEKQIIKLSVSTEGEVKAGDIECNPDVEIIPDVYEIDDEILGMAKGSTGSNVGTGGMATKLAAAKIATYSGADMIIANGEDVSVIEDIVDGKKIGTQFHANVNHTFNLEEYIMESMV